MDTFETTRLLSVLVISEVLNGELDSTVCMHVQYNILDESNGWDSTLILYMTYTADMSSGPHLEDQTHILTSQTSFSTSKFILALINGVTCILQFSNPYTLH